MHESFENVANFMMAARRGREREIEEKGREGGRMREREGRRRRKREKEMQRRE